MKDNKLRDKEIIEALECCSKNDAMLCYGCPFLKNCSRGFISRKALDLINSQQAEIEQWKEEANRYQTLWCEDVQTARAEAIKEFAERLKKEKYSICAGHGMSEYVVSGYDINNLVKEMVGEQG
jgi:FtsZ-binding cell division protein ZapB